MTGDILFDTFWLMTDVLSKVWSPIMLMCWGLVMLALVLKLQR